MMFFFKPKVIHLDCFTSEVIPHDFFPIDYSHKYFPQWWKDLPKVLDDPNQFWGMNTAKTCTGLNNFYSNGVTIPLWSDLLIRMNGQDIKWQFSDRTTQAGNHLLKQLGNYLDEREYYHIKILSPWIFNCKEDINFMWVQPTWSFNKPKEIIIPPGIIDYKYQGGTHINLFLNYTEENKQKDILLEAGQAMVNIIPLSERKIKIHCHLISLEEKDKREQNFGVSFVFRNKYIKKRRMMQSKEKKCPFGF